ncbi:MAG: hypothetical protein ACLTYN_17055 [Dysosmobacter welbionis]
MEGGVGDRGTGERRRSSPLIMGSDGGGLSHPDWMENLRLAVAVQEQALTDYPTLMRPLLLRNSRYNNTPPQVLCWWRWNRRKRPGGGGAGRPPVCGRAGKNAGGTKQRGNRPAVPGFLRKSKGRVQHFFHILLII